MTDDHHVARLLKSEVKYILLALAAVRWRRTSCAWLCGGWLTTGRRAMGNVRWGLIPISNYMGLLKQAGLVISERHGQFTLYRRDEDAIRGFLSAVEKELLKP